MAKALSLARDREIGKLTDCQVWDFAGLLNIDDERITNVSGHRLTDRVVFMLQLFSRSELPVARLVIARLLPWIVRSQNEDGSWGEEPVKDAATLAVVSALNRLIDCFGYDFILA